MWNFSCIERLLFALEAKEVLKFEFPANFRMFLKPGIDIVGELLRDWELYLAFLAILLTSVGKPYSKMNTLDGKPFEVYKPYIQNRFMVSKLAN